jgi:hypothetical protein
MVDAERDLSFALYLHGGTDDRDDDLEQSTIDFRRDWSEFAAITPAPASPIPDNARAVDAALVTGLIAAVPPEVIANVVSDIFRWIAARADRRVRVERSDGSSIELSRATPGEQRLLIADWLRQVP